MRRRKVPSLSRSRARVSEYNIKNDSMKDMKKFYGWSEQRTEQEVRRGAEKASQAEIKSLYERAYNREKNQ